MKKLMITLAVAAIAVASQAAAIKWTSSGALNGVALTSLDGDGTYAANGSAMKGNSALQYTILFYTAGTETVVDTWTGTLAYGTGVNTIQVSGNRTALSLNTSYDYLLTITGTQTDMLAYEDDDWTYAKTKVTGTTSGTFTTNKSGQSGLSANVSSWNVAGAEAVPEPTSAMLLLLGVAGLALKRKQK